MLTQSTKRICYAVEVLSHLIQVFVARARSSKLSYHQVLKIMEICDVGGTELPDLDETTGPNGSGLRI